MDNDNRMFPGSLPFGQGQGISNGGQGQPPLGAPPSVIPSEGVSLFAADPESIRGCLFRYTYFRLNGGRSFWFYPVYAGRTSVTGYQYNSNQNRWVYSGYDVSQIRSFSCI